ncbi:MAG: hypothetical protein MSIBF_01235 [Candidatus Altiarchaeales archaeon IMC4]|nr:MAG: hypothetical protein MSIBF_01235 [Candidatus Altiarchaeales archaeon IMC4]
MNKTNTGLLFFAAILAVSLSGCIGPDDTAKINESVGANLSEPNVVPGETGVPDNSTANAPDVSQTAQTDECEGMQGADADECHMNIALKEYDISTCTNIKNNLTRDLCTLLFDINESDNSTTVKGYVYNRDRDMRGWGGYENLTVSIYSHSKNATVASDVTDGLGFYEAHVPPKDRYAVIVDFNGKRLPQDIAYAQANYTYSMDFRIY